MVLASVLVLLTVTLIPTLRSYLGQRSDIAAMQAQVQAQRGTVAALQKERARWDDPAYVEQQARERLTFVRPGEKSYTVIDGDTAQQPVGEPAVASGQAPTSEREPWYGHLWSSMVMADEPGRATSPRPATSPGPAASPAR